MIQACAMSSQGRVVACYRYQWPEAGACTDSGWPCVIEHYDALIKSFSGQLRVVCFDMPGSGFSFPSYNYRFGIAESANFIIELLDARPVPKAAFAFTYANGFFG
jgi:pimeloyl-ACP methyl ester carboxylesterase